MSPLRKTPMLLALTAAVVLAWAAPSGATDAQVVSGASAKYYGYVTAAVVTGIPRCVVEALSRPSRAVPR